MEPDYVEQSRNITNFIEEKLQNMPPIDQECSIYRVPKRLLDRNYNAYVPKVISIGPFHHDQQNFRATEELKLRFLKSYQCRVVDMIRVQDIVEKVQSWEKKARQCYSEPLNMESEEFVKMMVLDGCFMVEFMIIMTINTPNIFPENQNTLHYSFYKAIKSDIWPDLIMLENQLPFFVLQGLFDLIVPTRLVEFINYSSTLNTKSCPSIDPFELVVHAFLNSRPLVNEIGEMINIFPSIMLNQNPRHLVDFLSLYFVRFKNKNNIVNEKYVAPSATELSEAGVVFKKVGGVERSIVDISFEKGILEIPRLLIDDAFETCVRNLLAYAQFCTWEESVTDYFQFLDELIVTEKDVKLLVKEGIIINIIGGNDKEISHLFNDICKNITVNIGTNCFSGIARDLRQHCERRRNKWMASLRHDYFHTPWTLISFLGAAFLLLLAFLQTIFTAMSTFK